MQKIFSIFVILLVSGYAHSEAAIEPAAIGTIAVAGDFPAAVAIQSPFYVGCGGTLIDRQHIVTAARCAMNSTNQLFNTYWMTVIGGDLNLSPPSIRREVRNVTHAFVHPNYNPITSNNDIAVLRVNIPFPEFHNTIEPAVRNTRLVDTTSTCRFAGWSTATPAAAAAIQPQQRVINSPILTTPQCNAANVHNNRVLPNMICSGSIGASAAASICNGNIGGGLFCGTDFTGVLVFGVSCGVANNPGVYIDVRQYEQWINSQLTRTDVPQPGWMSTPL